MKGVLKMSKINEIIGGLIFIRAVQRICPAGNNQQSCDILAKLSVGSWLRLLG